MECRKATQDMKDGNITNDDLRKTSHGKGKGKDKSNGAKSTPAPDKPKDQDMKYLGYEYDAEEGYIFMLKENETEEIDHRSGVDRTEVDGYTVNLE
eukprot:8320562-Pyramimonas_sp.AAC.1